MTLTPLLQKILLIILALIYSIIACAFALTRIYTYKAGIDDTGLTDQMFWNIIHHGRPCITINPPYIPQNNMGWHFSPIFYLLVPFYAIWPYWEIPQMAQSLCFGFSGVILFYALKAAGARNSEAWIGTTLYWFNLFVVSGAILDLHEIAFSNLFIAIALWSLAAKRFYAMLLALLLLLLTKEHYGLSVAGFGVLWAWHHRDWRRGTIVMMIGLSVFIFLFTVIMPALHGGPHPMLVHGSPESDRYGWLGDPWSLKIKTFYNIMFESGASSGITYLFLMLISGLMLPLAAPFYLAPAASDILANLLCAQPGQRIIPYNYSAAAILVIVAAGYQGYRWIMQRLAGRKYWFIFLLIPVVIKIFSFVFVPLNAWELDRLQLAADWRDIKAIKVLLSQGSVGVQPNIGMFFSQREAIYPFPHAIEKSSAVILHIFNPFITPLLRNKRSDWPYGEPAPQYFADVRNFMQQPGWHVVYWQTPWLVMERGEATENEHDVRTDIAQHIDRLEKTIP